MSLQEMLLNKLKTQNPNGYKFVMEVKNSGKNPIDVLSEMYQSGQLNDAQLSQIQNQGRMFGVRITNDDINKIKSVKNQQPKGSWF